jgi:hypothetical protein
VGSPANTIGTGEAGTNGRAEGCCHHWDNKEATMPVLIVPLLIGIPVLIGGGFLIYKVVGH